jgi:hypothetical protein
MKRQLPGATESELYGYTLLQFLQDHPDMPLGNTLVLQRLTGLNKEQLNMALDWLYEDGYIELTDTDGYVQ